MWGAGVELDEAAQANRLTDVIITRLPMDDPRVLQAARAFSDAIDDLNGIRRDLQDWEWPFRYEFLDHNPTTLPWAQMAVNQADASRAEITALLHLLDTVERTITSGDELRSVLPWLPSSLAERSPTSQQRYSNEVQQPDGQTSA
jgi:hypothetical protein